MMYLLLAWIIYLIIQDLITFLYPTRFDEKIYIKTVNDTNFNRDK